MVRILHPVCCGRSRFRDALLNVVLSSLLVTTSVTEKALAGPDDFYVSRIEWNVVLDSIVIDYDLIGSPDDRYNVEVVLLRKGDRDFRFEPRLVAGEIGNGQTAGMHKLITWSYKKDMLTLLSGDDFYFQLTVDKSGHFPWAIVAIGAAVGGLLTFLITSSDSKSSPPVELPYPPIRP